MSSTSHPSAVRTLSEARSLFPITESWIYFQNASIGPSPTPVVEAAESALRSQASQGTEAYPDWLQKNEQVRGQVAQLLNADSDEVSFVRNTAEGLARVALGLDWRQGDNVVTYAHEYPTNVLPWLALADRGVEVRQVPVTDGRISVDDIAALVDSRTRLVALSSVQFANGFRLDLEAIGSYCRERKILFSIDAIQHLGVLPFDVKAVPVDFVCAGAHKWLLSPTGSGVFYARKELHDSLRVVEVGYAGTKDYNLNDELLDYRLEYRPSAQRWEGGLASFSTLAGFGAAAELFNTLSLEAIEEHVIALTDQAAEGIQELGFKVMSPRENPEEKSAILSFVHPTVPAAEIKQFLAKRNISISMRTVHGTPVARISPHLYNTRDEVETFLAVLRDMPSSHQQEKRRAETM